jgi:hypothetical protein
MVKNGEDIEGTENIFNAATAPNKVKLNAIKKIGSGSISGVAVNYYKVSWKKVKHATGYQVYVKTKGSGWKRISSTTSRKCQIYIVKGFSGQIKVRAYITANSKSSSSSSYGAFSKVKKVKSK